MMPKRTGLLTALAALPAALLTVAVAPPVFAADPPAYQIDLTQLNDSGSTGTALLSLRGNALTVWIKSEGMVPGQPSAQHLHGSTDGHDFQCPDDGDDTNGDGILDNTEATVHYGDINISLTESGGTDAGSGLAVDRMPVADAQGKVSYKRTITVGQDVVEHIKDLHIVQHGVDRNDNGKYDFEGAGKSELDPKLPQEATAPTNCGVVKGAAVGSVPVGGVETGGGTADESSSGLVTGIAGAATAAGMLVIARRRKVPAAADAGAVAKTRDAA
ncbi:hypothetical protein [Streptomyces sp. NPDC048436]|uniref:hypothetical protein n=1 Tax=Streptomyces sp. NPDC048436 TaxID=3365550 RepID=UPI0037152B5A